ncbi:MAG: dTDP-4-dehydrorhamnose 3,5-epimerase [Candidatus Moranbacteria bacterium RIFCSPHIGHO2_12_FULL_54_9]|nr:MAG: dTDP-4-dehydrorhamnose 3,5-epimerase [Candidatus Moranbacteria bacterium RIFCSPHIGHO2_01_FULL_54_31]OGI25690.1 MAG: dTDP-4-dehydrorhamnose 3,5-epimerase [Candidatus Moranbacteria bacterium RIFCSPHIGHO2_12_FULL_54_9]
MNVEKTILDGVVIIEPDVLADERGFFMETFQEKRYQELLGADVRFVQDNLSSSKKGVLRGLHYQAPPFGQGKLVSVLMGTVLDVAVDIRFGSPTFGQHIAVELSDTNHRQLFIPVGFAHGFAVLSDTALFAYKCTALYSKEHDRGVRWNDSVLGIEWGVADPIVSEKDQQHPLLADISKEYIFEP